MSDKYRRAEKLLYSHKTTFNQWHELLADLETLNQATDVHAQSYTDYHASDGQVGDPAGDYVNRIMNMEHKARELGRKVRVIETVRSTLETSEDPRDAVKRQIMEFVYFEDAGMMELAVHLGINCRTLYRRRRELVYDVMTKWEEIKS